MWRVSFSHVNPGSMRRSRLLGHTSMLQAGSPAWIDPSPRDFGSRVALHARPPTRLAVQPGCGRIQSDRARKRPGRSLRNQWRADYFVHTNVYCSFHSPVFDCRRVFRRSLCIALYATHGPKIDQNNCTCHTRKSGYGNWAATSDVPFAARAVVHEAAGSADVAEGQYRRLVASCVSILSHS